MFERTLFIGLGGAGGATLRLLKKELGERLAALGWTGGVPSGWAFLHFDTAPTQDPQPIDVPQLAGHEYIGLRPEHLQEIPVAMIVERVFRTPGIVREVASWAGDLASEVHINLGLGAGRNRAVGRVLGLAASPVVAGGLASALGRLRSVDTVPELARLAELISCGIDGPIDVVRAYDSRIRVVIVSSLNGGTGSGILLDVLETVRSMGTNIDTVAFNDTSDVFCTTTETDDAANTLAALCELINRMMWGNPRPLPSGSGMRGVPVRRVIIGVQGGPPVLAPATLHYLVGRENRMGVTAGPDHHVFASVAGLLAGLQMEPELRDSVMFEEINAGNQVFMRTMTHEKEFLGSQADTLGAPAAFGALGFARVTLGTRALRQYAGERLARAAAERLMPQFPLTPVTETVIANHVAAFRAALVFEAAESSRAPVGRSTHDRVADDLPGTFSVSLEPTAIVNWIEQELDRIMTVLRDSPVADATVWTELVVAQASETKRTLERLAADHLALTVQSWVAKVNREMPDVLERMVGALGFASAKTIIEDVLAEIGAASDWLDELVDRAGELRSFATPGMLAEVAASEVVDSLSPRAIAGDSADVRRAVEEAVRHAWCSALADITERPALVLRSLAQGLLEPLVEALEFGFFAFRAGSDSRDDWPRWSPQLPPMRLQSAPYEFAVIDPAEYDTLFVSLLERTCGTSGAEARERAVLEVLTGSGHSDRSPVPTVEQRPRLVSVESAWQPGAEVTGATATAESVARYWPRVENRDLLAMADHWLMRADLPFSELFTADLRSYTSELPGGQDATAESTRRRNRVLLQISAAARAAEPMVRLSAAVLNGPLAGSPIERAPVRMLRCTLPFARHPLAEDAAKWLSTHLGEGAGTYPMKPVADYLVDTPTTTIDFLATLQTPVHPLAIESLMRPMAESWRVAQTDSASVDRFWRLRRARSLDEFIPTSQVQIRCMLRGWFTGNLLGLIRWEDDELVIEAISMGTSSIERFPRILLSQDGPGSLSRLEHLGLILESMPAALVSTALGSGWPDAVAAYRALAELGTSARGGTDWPLEYIAPTPSLKHWLDEGERAAPCTFRRTSSNSALHEAASERSDGEARIADALRWIDEELAVIRESAEPLLRLGGPEGAAAGRDGTAVRSTPAWFDLYDDIQGALEDLRSALVRYHDSLLAQMT